MGNGLSRVAERLQSAEKELKGAISIARSLPPTREGTNPPPPCGICRPDLPMHVTLVSTLRQVTAIRKTMEKAGKG